MHQCRDRTRVRSGLKPFQSHRPAQTAPPAATARVQGSALLQQRRAHLRSPERNSRQEGRLYERFRDEICRSESTAREHITGLTIPNRLRRAGCLEDPAFAVQGDNRVLFVERLSPRVYSDRQDVRPILQRCALRERGRIRRRLPLGLISLKQGPLAVARALNQSPPFGCPAGARGCVSQPLA